jgi:hypothetical protein
MKLNNWIWITKNLLSFHIWLRACLTFSLRSQVSPVQSTPFQNILHCNEGISSPSLLSPTFSLPSTFKVSQISIQRALSNNNHYRILMEVKVKMLFQWTSDNGISYPRQNMIKIHQTCLFNKRREWLRVKGKIKTSRLWASRSNITQLMGLLRTK